MLDVYRTRSRPPAQARRLSRSRSDQEGDLDAQGRTTRGAAAAASLARMKRRRTDEQFEFGLHMGL
ncbi:hypothetical protein ACU686_45385 [Yinghuangia aomiensis]